MLLAAARAETPLTEQNFHSVLGIRVVASSVSGGWLGSPATSSGGVPPFLGAGALLNIPQGEKKIGRSFYPRDSHDPLVGALFKGYPPGKPGGDPSTSVRNIPCNS